VVHTLIAAIIVVFFVMLIFLQNIRATIIPTLVIPVALLGTVIGLSALHFTLNQLDLFGMVLAIGIVVDDAIVVIENVERIMREEGLAPKEATRKAMVQISGAIVAITVVLAAVFVPSAMQPGATGIIYSQFALTIAVSMVFSAFLALSFTPSLCASPFSSPRIMGTGISCFDGSIADSTGWAARMSARSAVPCDVRRAGWSSS
jgi:multidrug efflux pump